MNRAVQYLLQRAGAVARRRWREEEQVAELYGRLGQTRRDERGWSTSTNDLARRRWLVGRDHRSDPTAARAPDSTDRKPGADGEGDSNDAGARRAADRRGRLLWAGVGASARCIGGGDRPRRGGSLRDAADGGESSREDRRASRATADAAGGEAGLV